MSCDDLHAALLGSGEVFDKLQEMVVELNLSDCVEFTGSVSDEALHRYLPTADVCLAADPKNPLNDVSTMNKFVEYTAMQRPIVSFDLVESRVSARDAALYARPNDERVFAQMIVALFDDECRRSSMGRIGRERVEQRLSWDHSRAHLLQAYAQLTGGAAPSSEGIPRYGDS